MKILIVDKLATFVKQQLEELGAEVLVDPTAKDAALSAKLASFNPEVLVVRSTKVTGPDLEAGRALALVIRAGAGVNTIDLATASRRGVYVANCPGKNAIAVAELTLAHLLNLDRRISDNVAALRESRWDKKGFGAARGLAGRTLAVLGAGEIGRAVIHRARAFDLKVRAFDIQLTAAGAEQLGVTLAASPEEAVRGADAVSVHLALNKETKGMLGRAFFAAMKEGAFFINTSRAEVVDEAALLWAIQDKGVKAGLDVFAQEPAGGQGAFTDVLCAEAGVYGTHHIGASTEQAEDAVGQEVVRIVAAHRTGATIPNCVNLAVLSPATHLIVVRHADRVGVLASVLAVLREAEINVHEMQNIVFAGAQAACARIAVNREPTPEVLERISKNEAIFSLSVSAS